MVVDEQAQAATITTSTIPSEMDELKTQITQLTEQVAALRVRQKSGGPKRCFYCNHIGHTQRSCPVRLTNQRCFICNRPGHLARDCWQGNGRGMSARGNSHPSYQ